MQLPEDVAPDEARAASSRLALADLAGHLNPRLLGSGLAALVGAKPAMPAFSPQLLPTFEAIAHDATSLPASEGKS